MENLPDLFYDKELCDAIRDIVKNSKTPIEEAMLYMKFSKNYKRDSKIVKKLSNVGVTIQIIMPVIKAMNNVK